LAAASPKQPVTTTNHQRSFAEVLHESCDVQVNQLPSPAIKGEELYIKITQSEYEKGLADCKKHLHGRLLLNRGEKPITAKELKTKLSSIWKTSGPWHLVSLGRGFYEFQFVSYEDMHLAWSMGSMNLKPGLLRLSKWTNDFNPYTQRQTHAQVWVRFMELPQEYWRRRTLFEIASAIGTPLSLDDATRNRAFGHYARILVDVDLSRRLFDEVVVEREGYAFKLAVVYERLPSFCTHCQVIGHMIASCNWIHPQKKQLDHGKKVVEFPKVVHKYVEKQHRNVPGPLGVVAHEAVHNTVVDIESDAEAVPKQQGIVVTAAADEEATRVSNNKSDTAFSFALINVQDEVVHRELEKTDCVLEQIVGEVNSPPTLEITPDVAQEDATQVDESQPIPETPNLLVADEHEFDDIARKDIALVQQAWADMAEQPFTPYVSKNQRKRNNKAARSAGQPYHTRSKGVPPSHSL
jgi:hypothetical protein